MRIMKLTRRQEVMRRLGSPRHRTQCRCGRIVEKLYLCWEVERLGSDDALTLDNASKVCILCVEKIEQRNQQVYRDRIRQEMGLRRAQADMQYYASRGSSPGYLAACEQMRREIPEAAWGSDGGVFKR